MCARAPVSALKMVVLPEFAFPATSTRGTRAAPPAAGSAGGGVSCAGRRHGAPPPAGVGEVGAAVRQKLDVRGVGVAQRKQIAAQPDLQGIAHRGPAHRLDAGARQQPHLHQPPRYARLAPDAMDHAGVACGQLVERVETLMHREGRLLVRRRRHRRPGVHDDDAK